MTCQGETVAPCDMLHQRAGRFVVMDRATWSKQGATWWCRCERCGAQTIFRGTKIRKAQREPDYLLKCSECGL